MTDVLLWLGVFSVTFAVDFVWTKYIVESGKKRPHHAAFWSTTMIPLAAVTANVYTSGNLWLLIPAMLGAYSSTWFAVWRESRK